MPPASSAEDPWDDWESEEYGRGQPLAASSEALNNARLWQTANNSLSFGPSPVHTGHSTLSNNQYLYDSSSSTSSPAPPAAFVPSLKILKRPSNNAGGGSGSLSSQAARDQQKKSLKDRERAYNEARNRIFGASSAVSSAGAVAGSSAPVSPSASPSGGATSPNMGLSPNNEATSLSSSVENLNLDERKGATNKNNARASPSLGSVNRSSGRGKSRASSNTGGSIDGVGSSLTTPVTSRPTTPLIPASGSTIIREPVNPPGAADKNSSATAQAHAKGFTKTRIKKQLRPEAAEWVPPGSSK